ncbi:MAG: TonB-dependent receptor [Hyphomicrobium sp.]
MTRKLTIAAATAAAIAAATLTTAGAGARAQEATVQLSETQTAEAELPAVVVEGATLEAKPVTRAKPKPQPKPAVVAEPELQSEPPPVAKKKKSQAAKSTGSANAKAPKPAEPAEAATEPVAAPANAAGDQPQNADAETIAGLPAQSVGNAVSVVTGAELKTRQVRNAGEALRSLPGVSVSQQGGAQNLTVVRLRGAESNHTLVLIDGVEVNAGSDGFFDFSTLMVDDIAQIEVIRGPQSGLYSSGALGGVINIITRGGKGPLTVRARAEGGSFDTRDGMVGISGGTDRMHGSLTLSGRRINGFDISSKGTEADGGDFNTLSFTGGIMVFDNLKIDTTLRHSRRKGDRDGTNDVLNGLFVASEERSTFASDLWLGRVEATLDTFEGAWIHKVFVTGTETDNRDNDLGPFSPPGGQASRNLSTASKYGYLSTYRLDGPEGVPVRHFITGLVEHQREQFEQPLLSANAFERDRDSVAGEVRGEYFNALTVTGNVRHDNNEGFEDATTWRVAGSLQPLGSPLRLHSSVGTGIKYPSFSEQFGVFSGFVANPGLTPETSLGWDAGVEATLLGGKAVIDFTYFNANLENEIDFNFVPPATACGGVPFCFIPFNRTGESKRDGVEVSGRLLVMEGLSVGAAYTYLNAHESDGQEEVRRAPHSGRADLNYAFLDGKANFNLAAVYNGRMQDLGFSAITFASQRVVLDDYWLVTAAASYKIAPGVELFGRVENLLDQNYQEVFGFNTAGAAAYAGLRITYEEPSTLDWQKYK